MRESTDKEGGREVMGRGDMGEGRGMRHDVSKTKGRGGNFVGKMDHTERAHGPFHKIGSRASTRREDGKY